MSDELAEGVFAAWAVRVEAGEDLSFDELLRGYPDIADELRRLHDDWKLFAPLLGRVVPGLIASSEHMSMPPLSSADDDGVEPPSAELLDRLGIHAPNTGRYRFRSVIGRGGGGVVIKVWDTKLNRPLAMKVVLGRGEGGRPTGDTPKIDGRTLSRFVDEARIASQLNHPGIVPVHELGADETGRAFFTMKLVRGETLATIFEHVKTGKDGWNQTRALTVLLRVCEAMAFAHDKGVVHRDLKPANIMVGRYGEVYVMDWGLARVAHKNHQADRRPAPSVPVSVVDSVRSVNRDRSPDSPLLSLDGVPIGTPMYMSPEQAQGDFAGTTPRSDVYSVGAILYELLAGHAPYLRAGTFLTSHDIIALVKLGPPPSLAQLTPRTPLELLAVCDKAMSRAAEERYVNVNALGRDLQAYLERRVVAAYATGTVAETKKWVQRNQLLASSFAATVLAATIGTFAFAFIASEKEAEATRADQSTLEAEQQLARAVARERELRVRGLIHELDVFDTSDDDVYTGMKQNSGPAYQWWIEWARRMIEGTLEDSARSSLWSPGLKDVQQRLAAMRAQSLPRTELEVEMDRRVDRDYTLQQRLIERRAWLLRMMGLDSWPSDSVFAEELSRVPAYEPTFNLLQRALRELGPDELVHGGPDIRTHGKERFALALIRRVIAACGQEELPQARAGLAIALYHTGAFAEALAVADVLCTEAPSNVAGEWEGFRNDIQRSVSQWTDHTVLAKYSQEIQDLETHIAALEPNIDNRHTWNFSEHEDVWWFSQLVRLESRLNGLRTRIDAAERSITSEVAQRAWSAAIHDISTSSTYSHTRWPSGKSLTPQVGLIPIGKDPRTGLWEFAHLETGTPAARDGSGSLVIEVDTGLVFILLPGGRVPSEEGQESWMHEPLSHFEIDSFFISKYEMTVDQWIRIGGRELPRQASRQLLPVTDVSWLEAVAALSHVSWLHMPSEAQWEYACRAKSACKWWPGDDPSLLMGVANIDMHTWDNDDGEIGTINARIPNPFGLHDVHGNVAEWCRDTPWLDKLPVRRRGDALWEDVAAGERVIRGGDWSSPPQLAASSTSSSAPEAVRAYGCGLRPARAVWP